MSKIKGKTVDYTSVHSLRANNIIQPSTAMALNGKRPIRDMSRLDPNNPRDVNHFLKVVSRTQETTCCDISDDHSPATTQECCEPDDEGSDNGYVGDDELEDDEFDDTASESSWITCSSSDESYSSDISSKSSFFQPGSPQGWRRFRGWLSDDEIDICRAAEALDSNASSFSGALDPSVFKPLVPAPLARRVSTPSLFAASISSRGDWETVANTEEYSAKFSTVDYNSDAAQLFDLTDSGEHFRDTFRFPHKDVGWEGVWYDRYESTQYSPCASVRSSSSSSIQESEAEESGEDDEDGPPVLGDVDALRTGWGSHCSSFSDLWEIASVHSGKDLIADDVESGHSEDKDEDSFCHIAKQFFGAFDFDGLLSSDYQLINNDRHSSKGNLPSMDDLCEEDSKTPRFNFLPHTPSLDCGCHWCDSHYYPTPDDTVHTLHDPNEWCHCPGCEIFSFQKAIPDMDKNGKGPDMQTSSEQDMNGLMGVMQIRQDALIPLSHPLPLRVWRLALTPTDDEADLSEEEQEQQQARITPSVLRKNASVDASVSCAGPRAPSPPSHPRPPFPFISSTDFSSVSSFIVGQVPPGEREFLLPVPFPFPSPISPPCSQHPPEQTQTQIQTQSQCQSQMQTHTQEDQQPPQTPRSPRYLPPHVQDQDQDQHRSRSRGRSRSGSGARSQPQSQYDEIRSPKPPRTYLQAHTPSRSGVAAVRPKEKHSARSSIWRWIRRILHCDPRPRDEDEEDHE